MADKQKEHTEIGKLRYDLRSRAVAASSNTRQYESYQMDPAMAEYSAEGIPGVAARATPEIPRLSAC